MSELTAKALHLEQGGLGNIVNTQVVFAADQDPYEDHLSTNLLPQDAEKFGKYLGPHAYARGWLSGTVVLQVPEGRNNPHGTLSDRASLEDFHTSYNAATQGGVWLPIAPQIGYGLKLMEAEGATLVTPGKKTELTKAQANVFGLKLVRLGLASNLINKTAGEGPVFEGPQTSSCDFNEATWDRAREALSGSRPTKACIVANRGIEHIQIFDRFLPESPGPTNIPFYGEHANFTYHLKTSFDFHAFSKLAIVNVTRATIHHSFDARLNYLCGQLIVQDSGSHILDDLPQFSEPVLADMGLEQFTYRGIAESGDQTYLY